MSEPDEEVTRGAEVEFLAPVLTTPTFRLEDNDGYQAVLTMDWHEIQEVPESALPNDCANLAANQDAPSHPGTYRVSVVEGTVEYPEINGFIWPDEKGILFSSTDHCESFFRDLNDSDVPSPPTQDNRFQLTFVQYIEQPSDNQDRTFPEPGFKLSYEAGPGGTCTVTGGTDLQPESESICEVAYGG